MICGQSARQHKRRSLLRLLCLGLLLFVAACEIPQQPGELWWDVDLNVPFGVRTYGMWELADPDSVLRQEGSGVGMSEDSGMYFSAWADLSAVLSDSLYSTPLDLRIERYLTAIEAPLDYDTLLNYTLGVLNPGIAALHGTVQDLPSHALTYTMTLPLPEGYDSLEVDTGTVNLVVVNRLAYGVSDLAIRWGNRTLISGRTLEPQQQAVVPVSLHEYIFNSNPGVTLSATGAGGNAITVDSTLRIAVTLQVDTVTASRFYGFVREQTVERDSSLFINQRHIIDLAIVESGNVTITLANRTQFADTVTLRIPNLVSRLNDTLTVTRFLLPGDSNVTIVPLAQYRLRPDGDADQTVQGKLISHSPGTTDRREFEGDGERVYGRLEFEQLQFEYFEGILNNLELPFDGINVELDRPPQGWESVQPVEVEARLHIEDGIGGSLDATINAYTSYLGTPIGETTVNVENVSLADDTTVTVTGLAGLLAEYPDLLTADGDAALNGEVALFNNTGINIAFELRAALSVTLTDDLEPVGTVERVSPGELEDIVSGEATITVRNHLPTGGRCYLVGDRDSSNVLAGSGADVDTLFDVMVPTPTVVNGRATGASELVFTVELDDRWLEYFRTPPFFVRTQILVAASNGDTLVIYGGDYVSVQALAKIVYTIRPGEIE